MGEYLWYRMIRILLLSLRLFYYIVPGARLGPPVIKGVQEMYEPDDAITVTCQPSRHSPTEPQPKLMWFMDGKEVCVTSRWHNLCMLSYFRIQINIVIIYCTYFTYEVSISLFILNEFEKVLICI